MNKRITLRQDDIDLLATLLEYEWEIQDDLADADAPSELGRHQQASLHAATLFERITGEEAAPLAEERRLKHLESFTKAIHNFGH